MKSNYNKLGNYITESKLKNKDSSETNLVGLSNEKKFTESKANIIGADLSKYKLIGYDQFVYMPTTSRNGDKISVALFKEKGGIISTSYTVFYVDADLLNPDYLMLWFERSEFDRYARYHSHGSVREIFSWEDMQNTELFVPPLEQQNKVVQIKNLIENRISILTNINKNLEELAKSIYRYHFIDFKPYALGGLMKESSLGLIPKDWLVQSIEEFVDDMKNGGTPKRGESDYWDNGTIPWLKTGEINNNIILKSEEHITELGLKNSSAKLLPINSIIMALYGKGTAARIGLLKIEATTNQACCAMICNDFNKTLYLYLFLLFNQKEIENLASGSVQQNLSKDLIANLELVAPPIEIIEKLPFKEIYNQIANNYFEIEYLTNLRDTLLPKLMSGDIDVSKINCDLEV